jgi:peptide/nickel transport system substrate-binding protein
VLFQFELLHRNDEIHTRLAEAIRENWALLGVTVTLKGVTPSELLTALDERAYQSALIDLNLADSPDPDPYPFWHQATVTGGQNYAKWDDRQASEYLEQGRVILNLEERVRLYRNFQVRFENETPALLLFYPVYTYAVDESVQGVRMGPLFAPSHRLDLLSNWFLMATQAAAPPGTANP